MKKLIILSLILSLVLVSCSGENSQKQEEKISDEDITKAFLNLVYTADKKDIEEFSKLTSSEPVQKEDVSKSSYENEYLAYLKDKYKNIPIEEKEWEDMLANRYLNFMAKMALDNDTTYKPEVIRLNYIEGLKEFEYEVDCAGKSYKGSVRLENGVIVNAEIDIKGK